jgi:hypothetical protein
MPPFDGSGLDVACANATQDAPAILERAGLNADPLLEAFVRRLMARRLSARFQTAHEALAVLELIETDRIAAARALSGVAAPVVVAAIGSGPMPVAMPANSDALSTHPVAAAVSPPVAAMARRSTEITHVEHVAGMRPARRRMWWAGSLAAALITVVGWSAGIRPDARAPRIDASLSSVDIDAARATPQLPPSFEAPVIPAPIAAVVSPVPAGPAPMVAHRRTAKRTAGVTPSMTRTDVVAPSVARTAVVPVVLEPEHVNAPDVATAGVLAARYVAVGRALRGAPDALWARYRLIRINDALASEDSRMKALVSLSDIERAIDR